MAYIFSYTSRNTQTYLRLWYTQNLVDPFLFEEEMINYLSFIYEDPFKI